MMTMSVGQAVGDLDEIADGALKAIFGIVEEAQILDLIDAEDERGAIDRPHQRTERLDDLEGAIFAVVGIERGDGLVRDRVSCRPYRYWRTRWSMRGSWRCR